MERHPKFARLHQSSQNTQEKAGQSTPHWGHANTFTQEEYLRVSNRWQDTDKEPIYSQPMTQKSQSPLPIKQAYHEDLPVHVNTRNDWTLESHLVKDPPRFDYPEPSIEGAMRHSPTHHWGPIKTQYDFTDHCLPASNIQSQYVSDPKIKSHLDTWSSNAKDFDFGSPVVARKSEIVSNDRDFNSRRFQLDNMSFDAGGIPDNTAMPNQPMHVYPAAPSDYQIATGRTLPLSSAVSSRPESRNSVPVSPVDARGAFTYNIGPSHVPNTHHSQPLPPVVEPGTGQANPHPNVPPTLMKLYERYGMAALRLIYLQRKQSAENLQLGSQRRHWNNSPHQQPAAQAFLDAPAAMSPGPVHNRSPVPQVHRVQIQGGHVNTVNPVAIDGSIDGESLAMPSSEFDNVNHQSSPGLKHMSFHQQTSWALQDNQSSHMSPMPSPMPAPVQQYNSPYPPDIASNSMYNQAQDTVSHTSSADFYSDEQYRKTPDVVTASTNIHNDADQFNSANHLNHEAFNDQTNKVSNHESDEVPSLSSLPTTFGLSAMRSHPEYDSFLPPRKKSRFAFEAAERLLASFSGVVHSGSKAANDRSSSGALGQESQYHDKLKAFSLHNQASATNEDIDQSDLLTNNSAPNVQLSLDREESNAGGEIACFQKDDANYTENDPISMKELQSALLDFDANTQVGEDMFDFDKNEDLETVENLRPDIQSKREQKHSAKGLGKHSKSISKQPCGKGVPKADVAEKPQPTPVRGRKPASKYNQGGIVCPRKAITKAWVSRQAKKNIEITPRRMLRTRVPTKTCICTDFTSKIKGKSIKTLARLRKKRLVMAGRKALKKKSVICKSGENVSIELTVHKDQRKKVGLLEQRLNALIRPDVAELKQIEKDLQMLEALNQQLLYGDKYLALLKLIGKRCISELEDKLKCRENVILVPMTKGGLKEVLFNKKSKLNLESRCFCRKPWRLPPANHHDRKQSHLLQCKCDAGHSFVVYDYQDMLSVTQSPAKREKKSDKKDSKRKSPRKAAAKVETVPENHTTESNSKGFEVDCPPDLSQHSDLVNSTKQLAEPCSDSDLSVRDIPFYKSTLPKKRGKLWHATSLALSAARTEAAKAQKRKTDAGAKDEDTVATIPEKGDTILKLSGPTIVPPLEEPDTAVSSAPNQVIISLAIDGLAADTGNIAAFTEVKTTGNINEDCQTDSVDHSLSEIVDSAENLIDCEGDAVVTSPDKDCVAKLKAGAQRKRQVSGSVKTIPVTNWKSIKLVVPQTNANTDKEKDTNSVVNDTSAESKGKKKKWETASIKQCPHCAYTTRVKSHLNRHMKLHDVSSQLPCPHCAKTFCERGRLEAHVQACHTAESVQLACPTCGKVYKSSEGLRVHVRRDHRRQHKYVCEICNHGFQQIHQYEGHMNKHSGERPFHCDKCEKSFRYRNNRNTHQRSCAGKIKT